MFKGKPDKRAAEKESPKQFSGEVVIDPTAAEALQQLNSLRKSEYGVKTSAKEKKLRLSQGQDPPSWQDSQKQSHRSERKKSRK